MNDFPSDPGSLTSQERVPPLKRFGLLILAAFTLALNHSLMVTRGVVSLKLVLLGSLLLGVGILVALRPEYLRLFKRHPDTAGGPPRWIAVAVVLASLGFAFWLWNFGYRAS